MFALYVIIIIHVSYENSTDCLNILAVLSYKWAAVNRDGYVDAVIVKTTDICFHFIRHKSLFLF